jgi:hypothetical protein
MPAFESSCGAPCKVTMCANSSVPESVWHASTPSAEHHQIRLMVTEAPRDSFGLASTMQDCEAKGFWRNKGCRFVGSAKAALLSVVHCSPQYTHNV